MIRRFCFVCVLVAVTMGQMCATDNTPGPEPEPLPQVELKTNAGTIVIELFTTHTQAAVRFKELVDAGYYNDAIFHEVVSGSRIIGGMYDVDLTKIAEPSPALTNDSGNGLANIAGRVSLYTPAGGGQPAAFLINVDDNPDLNYDAAGGEAVDYTVIGRVLEGLSVATTISQRSTESRWTPNLPRLPEAPVFVNNPSPGVSDYPTDPEPDFADGQQLSVGAGSAAIAASDFNRDGDLDLVVVNETSNNVVLLLGGENGTFRAATTAATGLSRPVALAAGDLDNDGDVDLAVVNNGSQKVTVLLNDGRGVFPADQTAEYAVGADPRAIVAGNLDSDGFADLAVANQGSSNVTVLLNDRNGVFSLSQTVSTVPEPDPEQSEPPAATSGANSLAIADFNRDGSNDLAVGNAGTKNVTILRNLGSGSLKAEPAFELVDRPIQLLARDLSGDNQDDLCVGFAATNKVAVLQNASNLEFGFATQPDVGTAPTRVALADLDRNGVTDLLVANEGSNEFSALLNKGAGAFLDAVSFPTGSSPAGIATGDFDGDQDVDLAVVSRSGSVFIHLNTLNGPEPVADGFTVTSSGLKYKDVVTGTGRTVTGESTVRVFYTGRLNDENGSVFDSTEGLDEPREFQLSGLIEGWQEGLGQYNMREGGTRILIIPPELGYGSQSQPGIPANSTLWFEVEVVEIVGP